MQDTAAAATALPPALLLKNGPNVADLLGDGTRSQIFIAWRENFNAHGFSTVAFSLFAGNYPGDTTSVWQAVPFFGGPYDGDSGREQLRTSEGADCTLGDLRVVPHARRPVEVVLAGRELGESFADSAPVRFDYYTLTRNADGVPGWPPYFFKHTRTVPAKRQYCDVNEAFARELGLGTRGLGHAEGGR